MTGTDKGGAALSRPSEMLIQCALDYAAIDFKVGPVGRNKAPLTENGYRNYSDDPSWIEKMFRHPRASRAEGIGIAAGVSGLLVLDIDPRNGGDESFIRLEEDIGPFPETVTCLTGGGGRHYYFFTQGKDYWVAKLPGYPGIDILSAGKQVVVPPSMHPSGRMYSWVEGHSLFQMDPAPIPAALDRLLRDASNRRSSKRCVKTDIHAGKVPNGSRNIFLASRAGQLWTPGKSPEEHLEQLQAVNKKRCDPPLSDTRVRRTSRSIQKYPRAAFTGERVVREEPPLWIPPPGSPVLIGDIVGMYIEMMPGGDPDMLIATLATYAANWLPGHKPVWMTLVSGTRTGKTVTLECLEYLPAIQPVGHLSEPALMSGSPRDYTGPAANGGLLMGPGEFRVMVQSDHSSTLALPHAAQEALYAALRDVYDGKRVKATGADGGSTISWEGKRGVLIGATPRIDRSHTVRRELGPRFLCYRRRLYNPAHGMIPPTPVREAELHERLKERVVGVFSGIPEISSDALQIPPELHAPLYNIAESMARRRGDVELDKKGALTRPVKIEPPQHLYHNLSSLMMGYQAIGVDNDTALRGIVRVAMSTIPVNRAEVIQALSRGRVPLSRAQIQRRSGLGEFPVKTALAELQHLGVVARTGEGRGTTYLLLEQFKNKDERQERPEGGM